MALVLGTNAGFVTTAPTDDPTGGVTTTTDAIARVGRDTSPATAGKVTEIGWWCDNATEESNFEVGLYAADGAVVPGEAGTLLEVSRTNAKGTTAGWKVVTGLNWTISGNTVYWLGVQVDDTATATKIDYYLTNGDGIDGILADTLPDSFGGGEYQANQIISIYAVWGAAAGTNMKVNIGDVFKDVSEIKINIGDVWKSVTQAKVNIGDAWKTIYG